MQVSVGEAKKLESFAKEKCFTLQRSLGTVSTVSYQLGETKLMPARPVTDILNELLMLNEFLRKVRFCVTSANINTTLRWGSQLITLAEAITFRTQSMSWESTLQPLTQAQQITRNSSRYGASPVVEYTEITYDLKEITDLYTSAKKNTRELYALIDAANLSTMVEIPDDMYTKLTNNPVA